MLPKVFASFSFTTRKYNWLIERSSCDSHRGMGVTSALTEVPQAVLTGVHTHLQHPHQLEVIYLGQGLLQKSSGVTPGSLHALG